MRMYMVSRQLKLSDKHPTHPGYILSVRSVVMADNRRVARKQANESCQYALVQMNAVTKGEWVGDAVVLYCMGRVQ